MLGIRASGGFGNSGMFITRNDERIHCILDVWIHILAFRTSWGIAHRALVHIISASWDLWVDVVAIRTSWGFVRRALQLSPGTISASISKLFDAIFSVSC